MASTPSYDPNTLSSPSSYERLAHESSAPLLNRAVQYGYAPGSTFKVVTATAAIDTGQFTPQSTLSGRNDLLVSGVPLANDDNESYGEITLTEALAKSVNTVWAQVAEHVGKRDAGALHEPLRLRRQAPARLPRRRDVRQRRPTRANACSRRPAR